jgi:hypothetical protein
MTAQRRRSILLAVLGLALVALAFRNLEWRSMLAALAKADLRPVALAGVLALVVVAWPGAARLWSFVRILPGSPGMSYGTFVSVYVASTAAHNVLPAPAGEVLRTVYIARRHGYSIGGLTAAQLLDKLVDTLGLGLEALLFVALLEVPGRMGLHFFIFGTVCCTAVLVLFLWARRRPMGDEQAGPPSGRMQKFMWQLREGFSLLGRPAALGRALAWSMASDLGTLLTVPLILAALGMSASPAAWFAAMVAARLTGVVPMTPGQLGVQEAGVAGALKLFGVDDSSAVAFALVYRVVHFVPVTLAGLFELRRLGPMARETRA